MALGARPRDVLALVMREGMTPVALGAASGVALAALSAPLMRALLYGIAPIDPVSVASAAALILAVAAAAAFMAARRAAAIDPIVALRDSLPASSQKHSDLSRPIEVWKLLAGSWQRGSWKLKPMIEFRP
jgi:FtsX-like permease family